MKRLTTPDLRPANPNFSSGPCAKRPGFTLEALSGALLGRSHRATEPKAKLAEVIVRSKAILGMPGDWRLGIVPASDTGAVEMVLWSMLGARPVDILSFESFGEGWATDIVKHLKLPNARVLSAGYGDLPDLSATDPSHDIVFPWNGTTSGVRIPNADWIAADRQGLTLCDATSAAFAPWVAPHNPFDLATLELSDARLPPAWEAEGKVRYLLGTDDQGRDILSALHVRKKPAAAPLAAFVGSLLATQLALTLAVGRRVLRLDARALVIAANAAVGGPATAAGGAVLDAELVAVDRAAGNRIRPFQDLSTRARGGGAAVPRAPERSRWRPMAHRDHCAAGDAAPTRAPRARVA